MPVYFIVLLILVAPTVQVIKSLSPTGIRLTAATASGKFQLGVWPDQMIRIGRSQILPIISGVAAALTALLYASFDLLADRPETSVIGMWSSRGGVTAMLAIPSVIFSVVASGTALFLGLRKARRPPTSASVHLRDFVPGPLLLAAVLVAAMGAVCAIGGLVGDLNSDFPLAIALTSPAMIAAAVSLLALATFALSGRRIVMRSNGDLPEVWATVVVAQALYLVIATALLSGFAAVSMGSHIAATRIALLNPRSVLLDNLQLVSFVSVALVVLTIILLPVLAEPAGPFRAMGILHPEQYRRSQALLRDAYPLRTVGSDKADAPQSEPARILNER